jgi:hypothetical protein
VEEQTNEQQQGQDDPELGGDLEVGEDEADNVMGGLRSNPDLGAQRA